MFVKKLLKNIYTRILVSKIKKNIRIARNENNKIFYLFAAPTYGNLGDQAIAYAETEFVIKNNSNAKIIDIPLYSFELFKITIDSIKPFVTKEDIFLGLGGGNMGIEYLREEQSRRYIAEKFPHNKVIIFPQTIYFGNTEQGEEELKKSIESYSKNRNMTIIARERYSYEKMVDFFSFNDVILTPDIVLSLNIFNEISSEREGILLCLRNDAESILSLADKSHIKEICEDKLNIKFTDTILNEDRISTNRRKQLVINKLKEFASSKLVITDRLHGMVFSAISGTPCIVFSNYNYKVIGTYEWIKDLNYIQFCNDIDCLDKMIMELLNIECNLYMSNTFNEYWNKIANLIK